MLSVRDAVLCPSIRHYAKLVDLWQQDGQVEIAEYKSAAGATRTSRNVCNQVAI